MFINWNNRQLNLKIVYYGPALSGKTTNLEMIYSRINPERRSDLVSLNTVEDRTLFFDFLQLELGKISGLVPKIQLFTVPGQIYYQASRKIVLRGADGVVFVADSDPNRKVDTLESWHNFHTHLEELNLSKEHLPVVLQFNKQDLKGALRIDEMRRLLHTNGCPYFPAVAKEGLGVLDTLKTIVNEVILSVQKELV